MNTANRKSVHLPSILEMEPKRARRFWTMFMADHDFAVRELCVKAEFVRLAIEEWVLNHGRDAEPTSKRNLEQRLADFEALRSRDV